MTAIQEAVKKLFNKEAHKDINPDEVVAIGAAIQGGIMQGDVRDILLLDVIPLSLGIETMGEVMTKIIEKNTTIPVAKTQIFSTAADSQPAVDIKVLQGERPMSADNKLLGKFILDGIPPAPRGVPQIEVTFDIDANGILNVKAIDKATNKEQSIKIEGSSGITDEEKEKMMSDAEKHAAEDEKKKESAEIKNIAETLVYSAEKAMKDGGDKIKEEDKKEVEEKIERLKSVKDGEDIEIIKKASEDLSQSVQKIGQAMYNEAKKEEDEKKKEEGEKKEEEKKNE